VIGNVPIVYDGDTPDLNRMYRCHVVPIAIC
jgi:hypothetical protein